MILLRSIIKESRDERKNPDRDPNEPSKWFRATSASSVGIEMAIAICGCTLGASWLERHVTHWSPWTMLIGLAIGIAAASKPIFRLIREHERDAAARAAALAETDAPKTDAGT